MRISEDRYSRDLRRLNLAERFIRHEVRTHWICGWTGLSHHRVRNLYRSYAKTSGAVLRHRGPSPTRLATYLRSPALRAEASAIGGLARAFEIVPPKPAPGAWRDRANIEAGERLCAVFELYQQVVPQSRFTMDQFIRLAIALTEGDYLEMGHCTSCHAALLVERLVPTRRICLACQQDALIGSHVGPAETRNAAEVEPPTCGAAETPESYQQPLF
jgi:hypothetical protein